MLTSHTKADSSSYSLVVIVYLQRFHRNTVEVCAAAEDRKKQY